MGDCVLNLIAGKVVCLLCFIEARCLLMVNYVCWGGLFVTMCVSMRFLLTFNNHTVRAKDLRNMRKVFEIILHPAQVP